MKTTTSGTDKDSLYSYIERANVPKSHSKLVKIARFKGVVFAATMSMCIALLDVYRRFDILGFSVLFFCLVLFYYGLCEFGKFKWTELFSMGVQGVSSGYWGYMKIYLGRCTNHFSDRILRSSAFIFVAGFYYPIF